VSEKFTLANKNHLSFFLEVLVAMGALCPVCGKGTRRTSKRWARCKECGERVRRHTEEEIHDAHRTGEKLRTDA